MVTLNTDNRTINHDTRGDSNVFHLNIPLICLRKRFLKP